MEQRHEWNKIELMLIDLAAQVNQANFFTPILEWSLVNMTTL